MSIRRVFTNTSYLAFVQLANYLVPFLVIPYLSRTLSVESFGFVMTLLALIQFGYIVTEFGLNISATKKIIDNQSDFDLISKINGSVVLIKTTITIIYMVFVTLYYSWSLNIELLIGAFICIYLQGLQPIWYFTALEKFREISVVLLFGKIIYLPLVFIFVRSEQEIVWIFYSLAISQLCALILSVTLLKRYFFAGKKIIVLDVAEALREAKVALRFFLSRVTVNLQYFVGTPIVNLFIGPANAGFYSSAENLSKAIRGIAGSFVQALYPYMIKDKNEKMFLRLTLLSLMLLVMGCLIAYVISEWLVVAIFGSKYVESVPYFNLLLVSVILSYLNGCFGYPAFSIFNKLNLANNINMLNVIFFMFPMFVGYAWLDSFSIYLLIISIIISELLSLTFKVIYFIRLKRDKGKRGLVQ